MKLYNRSDRTTDSAVLLGIATGVGTVALYFAGGLILAEWSITDFLTHLTVGTIGTVALWSGLTATVFTIPITLYFRYRIITPLVPLTFMFLGWVIYSAATGLLTTETVFGLGLYAIGLSPFYLVLFGIAGGIERYIRSRRDATSQ